MLNVSTPNHPGKIVFIDGNTGKIVSEDDASTVPESIRFANTPNGKVPVVKVVSLVEGDQRSIKEYGPSGELLRTTLQRRSS